MVCSSVAAYDDKPTAVREIVMFKLPFRERRRSAAVARLGILDTPAEAGFDRYVEQAAAAFAAPIALLSLIHGDQQWFKATYGLAIDCVPRRNSFCTFTLDKPDVFECCDPQNDPRFADLPGVVGDPFVRYYIGAPLRRLKGIDIGALCVVDTVRREPASIDQKAYLCGLARQAALAIEARRDILGAAA